MPAIDELLPQAIAEALPLDAEEPGALPRFAGEAGAGLDDVVADHLGGPFTGALAEAVRPARRFPLAPRRHTKRRLGLLAIALTLAVASAATYYDTTGQFGSQVAAAPARAVPGSASAQLANAANAALKPLGSAVDVIVSRNDTLDSIFRRLSVSVQDLAAVRGLPGIRASLDRLRPGDVITLRHVNGDLLSLTRRVSETETLSVERGDPAAAFRAEVTTTPLEARSGPLRGRIESSLFEAVNASGASDGVAVQLAELFRYDVDFAQELQRGDEFTLVVERLYRDGQFLRYGDIIAAEFTNAGHTYRAVRYTLPDGTTEYYTPDGKSLRRAFLKSPLPFSRISSGFGVRWHPVLNRVKAHKGVDYAAPTGTPVRAAGNGRVAFRGVKGGYGNVIILRHGNGVETLYGHLSRFSKGLFVGKVVRQGDIIGAVGMTGMATGPHLHYEYRVNGVHKNPAKLKFVNADPISAKLKPDFTNHTAPLLAQLEAAKQTAPVAVGE
jgi:murein DD-endopeptidase MepM/ murein hydrolase activator NlpD